MTFFVGHLQLPFAQDELAHLHLVGRAKTLLQITGFGQNATTDVGKDRIDLQHFVKVGFHPVSPIDHFVFVTGNFKPFATTFQFDQGDIGEAHLVDWCEATLSGEMGLVTWGHMLRGKNKKGESNQQWRRNQ